MRRTINTVLLVLLMVIVIWATVKIMTTIQKTTGDLVAPVNVLNTQAAGIFNSTPTVIPDPVTIIRDVRSLARLETIHYTLEKVVTAETGTGDLSFLFGDKLLFVAHGKVIAGVNMEKLEEEDFNLRNGVLHVTLPKPEVFVAALDNEKSYVYDRDTGLLSKGDLNLETLARQSAEEAILAAAMDDGILEQAEVNAENYLVRLFRSLGYPDVVFEFSDEN